MLKKLFFISFLLTLFNLVGQNLDPLRTDDYFLQEKWVDSILSSMTIDEKIGQLFMIQAYSNLDSVHENEIKEMIEEYPALKLQYQRFLEVYNLCKDDFAGKSDNAF